MEADVPNVGPVGRARKGPWRLRAQGGTFWGAEVCWLKI